MILYRCQQRPIVLLEVLIAFALIVLCALPLIYPHIFVLKSEKAFVSTIQLDHAVNLLYINRLEKLYQNKIDWHEIESGKEVVIDTQMLTESGIREPLSFTGTYHFEEMTHKPQDPVEKTIYLYSMIFNFLPTKDIAPYLDRKPIKYEYSLVIERKHQ